MFNDLGEEINLQPITNIGLPKWPAMLVIGSKVTKAQAAEIIIRTTNFRFLSNDESFVKELNLKLNIKTYDSIKFNIDEYNLCIATIDAANIKYNSIELDFLHNERIVSCYIGGSYGWCDWEGNIGTAQYNIGKYPSAEGVFAEWQRIAEAFPYLELRCQLFDKEWCQEGLAPIIEYFVKDGKVTAYLPKCSLLDSITKTEKFEDTKYDINLERGCTIEQFEEALKLVYEKN